MATALRILLWAIVVIAPGGILLAPLLAAHELRRRSAVRVVANNGNALPAAVLNRISHVPSQL